MSVVPPAKKKAKMATATASPRPNWFLAIQFDNSSIQEKMKSVQDHIVNLEPKLSQACVPIHKAHITLFVFHAKNVQKVTDVVSEVVENFRHESDGEMTIEADKIGTFNNQVVFTKLKLDQSVQCLWETLKV